MRKYDLVTNLFESTTKYVKACGKRSILETKPFQGKINAKELGVVFPDGQINFQNEDAILKYIYKRLRDSLNRPKAEQFERVIAKKGVTIIGENDGTYDSVTLKNIKGMIERVNKDVSRDLEVFHSHPDRYGKGRATPLSGPNGGDISTFFKAKLKKSVAVNSKGEFNSIEIGKDFSADKFKLFQEEFMSFIDQRLYSGLLKKYKNLYQEISKYYDLGSGDYIGPKGLKKEFDEVIGKVDQIAINLEKSEVYAKTLHEFYKKAGDYGMIYSTNFSNLVHSSKLELLSKLKNWVILKFNL